MNPSESASQEPVHLQQPECHLPLAEEAASDSLPNIQTESKSKRTATCWCNLRGSNEESHDCCLPLYAENMLQARKRYTATPDAPFNSRDEQWHWLVGLEKALAPRCSDAVKISEANEVSKAPAKQCWTMPGCRPTCW